MSVRAEIAGSIGALLLVQIATTFGAIALLSRMTPAIAQIRGQNLTTIEAARRMGEALALAPHDPEAAQLAFSSALDQARQHVSEPDETPLLREIAARQQAALAGVPAAVRPTLQALGDLARVNARAAEEADEQARRLGTAGAWSAVLLGLAGFVVSVVAIRRLSQRIVMPLTDLHETVVAWRAGDPFRRSRCVDAPQEFETVASTVDELIDEQLAMRAATTPAPPPERTLVRRALLRLLDDQPGAQAVVDATGEVLAASRGALALLGGEEGAAWAAHLRAAAAGREAPGVATQVLGEGGVLCTLSPPQPPGGQAPERP